MTNPVAVSLRLVDGSGQAEVDEDRPTVGEHNIARLDVAVDHSHRVHAPRASARPVDSRPRAGKRSGPWSATARSSDGPRT